MEKFAAMSAPPKIIFGGKIKNSPPILPPKNVGGGKTKMASDYYIGIDVGTKSVRAGLYDSNGVMKAHHSIPIAVWTNPGVLEDSYEQSSDNIWSAVQCTVKVLL